MIVRPLSLSDVPAYRALMLHAYAQAPDAFTATPEERAGLPDAWWAQRIADPDDGGLAFGAFVDERLVGSVALEYSRRPRTRHRVLLIGMYVHDTARGRGAGRALVEAALAHARARPGMRTMVLTVTEGNEPALRLYRACGFEAFGTEPMAVAVAAADGFLAKVHMACRLEAPRAAPGDPAAAVQRQLDAYNDRDLARFVAEYADDVRVFRPPSPDPVLAGKAAFADHYARHRFGRADLHAELVNRIVCGRRVVDHERVRGLSDDGSLVEAVAVYDVGDDGRIRTVWFH